MGNNHCEEMSRHDPTLLQSINLILNVMLGDLQSGDSEKQKMCQSLIMMLRRFSLFSRSEDFFSRMSSNVQ